MLDQTSHFRTFGFVVLRQFFDPLPLEEEIDRVIRDGPVSSFEVSGGSEIQFQYVPMMTTETPRSLLLLDQVAVEAGSLLGGPVIPTRAKGVSYRGNTPWHQDSTLQVASVGAAAYMESLDAESGALRVIPGSHRVEFGDALRGLGVAGMPAEALPSHAIATKPGDMILFDEHLFHSSARGGIRRQWRMDYLRDPATTEETDRTKAYFADIYPPDWDGGYDVDRFPSYGPSRRNSRRPCVARLEALGVYELAEKQEAFTRSRR